MQNKNDPSFYGQMAYDHETILQQLQSFRNDPTSIVPYLKQRLTRYRQYQGSQFLFSQKYRKKAIQIHEQQKSQNRIRELVGILLGQTRAMPPLQTIPKLDQLASKLCLTIHPQMKSVIQFKPETAQILRQELNQDPIYHYPNSVVCLVSLGFDQPYQSLMNLLLDDGVKNRSNRKALLNPNFKYFGLASVKSPTDPELRCTIYVLADQVIKKSQIQPQQVQYPIQTPNTLQVDPSIVQKNSNQSQETGRFPSYSASTPSDQNQFNRNTYPLQNNDINNQNQIIKESIQFREHQIRENSPQKTERTVERDTFNSILRNADNPKVFVNLNRKSPNPYMVTSVDPFERKTFVNSNSPQNIANSQAH